MHKPVWPRGKALGWYTDVLGWYTDVYNDVLGWCTDVLDWYTEVLGWYIDVLSWYTDGVGLISKFGSLFPSKVVVYGARVMTLPFTINETSKWFSSLPMLMQKPLWW